MQSVVSISPIRYDTFNQSNSKTFIWILRKLQRSDKWTKFNLKGGGLRESPRAEGTGQIDCCCTVCCCSLKRGEWQERGENHYETTSCICMFVVRLTQEEGRYWEKAKTSGRLLRKRGDTGRSKPLRGAVTTSHHCTVWNYITTERVWVL